MSPTTDWRRCLIGTLLCITLCMSLTGCGLISRRYANSRPDGSPVTLPNPMVIPVSELDFTWLQIVDMVDDYFEIQREQQPREIGGLLMEGQIQTQPLAGATFMEWARRDSTPGYERWHSSLQSIRRTAYVRAIPVADGFEIHLHVQKELEDVSQPEFSTVSQSLQRHDGSLVAVNLSQDDLGPETLDWIDIGRDESLEQEMLSNLHARLFDVAESPILPQ